MRSLITRGKQDVRKTLDRRTRELNTIREIFHDINATADLRSILEGITKSTTRALEADSCSIYLLEPASQRLILKATTGLYPDAVDHAFLQMGQGLTGWSAENRVAIAVKDAWHDKRFFQVPNTREKPFTSLMSSPLLSQDRVIGAINVQTLAPREWSEGDVEFLEIIADVVAGVLERAILSEQTERRMMDLSAVAEVSKAVIAPSYLDETLRVVTQMAAGALKARRCSLLLLDEVERKYTQRAAYDAKTQNLREPSWSINKPPIENAIDLNSGPTMVLRPAQNLIERMAHWASEQQFAAFLCVPLQINNRVIGLMNVWSEFEQPFQDDQVQLCKTLANQIALAIENAYLVGNAAIVKEMNHRVKNNLQKVVMLLQLQLADDKSQLSARDVLHESINRIMSIAAVHDALAQEGFRLVDVADLVRRVTQLVHANMARPDQHLEIEVNGDSLKLPARAATAIALVVNELVQNAMEHAFVGRSEGKISVRLRDEHGNFVIEVRDDGRGSAALRNGQRPQSLGLNIVDTLVKDDLRGTFELNHDAQGSVATVTAPISFS